MEELVANVKDGHAEDADRSMAQLLQACYHPAFFEGGSSLLSCSKAIMLHYLKTRVASHCRQLQQEALATLEEAKIPEPDLCWRTVEVLAQHIKCLQHFYLQQSAGHAHTALYQLDKSYFKMARKEGDLANKCGPGHAMTLGVVQKREAYLLAKKATFLTLMEVYTWAILLVRTRRSSVHALAARAMVELLVTSRRYPPAHERVQNIWRTRFEKLTEKNRTDNRTEEGTEEPVKSFKDFPQFLQFLKERLGDAEKGGGQEGCPETSTYWSELFAHVEPFVQEDESVRGSEERRCTEVLLQRLEGQLLLAQAAYARTGIVDCALNIEFYSDCLDASESNQKISRKKVADAEKKKAKLQEVAEACAHKLRALGLEPPPDNAEDHAPVLQYDTNLMVEVRQAVPMPHDYTKAEAEHIWWVHLHMRKMISKATQVTSILQLPLPKENRCHLVPSRCPACLLPSHASSPGFLPLSQHRVNAWIHVLGNKPGAPL